MVSGLWSLKNLGRQWLSSALRDDTAKLNIIKPDAIIYYVDSLELVATVESTSHLNWKLLIISINWLIYSLDSQKIEAEAQGPYLLMAKFLMY